MIRDEAEFLEGVLLSLKNVISLAASAVSVRSPVAIFGADAILGVVGADAAFGADAIFGSASISSLCAAVWIAP